MKCDELKPIELECNMGKDINGVEHREPWKAYDIDEVDAAIAELKAELENVQASMYCDVLDAGIENRRLKRALYKALANWALSTLAWLDCIDQGNPAKWSEMHRKCLAKAEKYARGFVRDSSKGIKGNTPPQVQEFKPNSTAQ